MDLQKLFDRVRYVDEGTASERLIRLHRAFAFSILYEAIDVFFFHQIS